MRSLNKEVHEDFSQQWKALKEQKDNDPPDIPKILKNLVVMVSFYKSCTLDHIKALKFMTVNSSDSAFSGGS